MHALIVTLYALIVVNGLLVLLLFLFGEPIDNHRHAEDDTFDAHVDDALTVAEPRPALRSVQ